MRAGACACVLLAWAAAASAAPRWIRVDTPNFIVVGAAGERQLANVGAQFEGFREALTELISKTAVSSPVPTVVIVFPDDKSFEPFKPPYQGRPVNVGGSFASRSHINYILLAPPREDGDNLRAVFHEFTHLMIRNTSPGIPLWLNEGLAEYYSSFQIENNGGAVVVGRPIESHLQLLAGRPWMPLSELIEATEASPEYNESSRRGIFYAESWALVHMLLQGGPDRSRQLSDYVDAALAGASSDAAWAQAFGREDVFAALQQYLRHPVLRSRRYVMAARIEGTPASAVPLPDSARQTLFEEVLVALGHTDRVQPRRTISADGDWFNDYMVAADLFASGVPAELSDRLAAQAALDRVLAARGDLLNALYMSGILDDVTGRNPPRAVEYLRRVHRAVPARDDYSLAFAEALARAGDFANAKAVTEDVIAHPHLDGMKQQALDVMREIATAERGRGARDEGRVRAAEEPTRSCPAASRSAAAAASTAARFQLRRPSC